MRPGVCTGAGRLVIPGGVDGHPPHRSTHRRLRTTDTFGTPRRQRCGTILDFGIPRNDDEQPLDDVRRKLELAPESGCDVGLHGSVIHWDDTVPAELDDVGHGHPVG